MPQDTPQTVLSQPSSPVPDLLPVTYDLSLCLWPFGRFHFPASSPLVDPAAALPRADFSPTPWPVPLSPCGSLQTVIHFLFQGKLGNSCGHNDHRQSQNSRISTFSPNSTLRATFPLMVTRSTCLSQPLSNLRRSRHAPSQPAAPASPGCVTPTLLEPSLEKY